jgi:hypothetical protein
MMQRRLEARQFVEFGKFLDPLVGCLEFEARS